MPIKASADKIRNELEGFCASASPEEDEGVIELKAQTSFASKKSKSVAKAGSGKSQTEILRSLGVPESEVYKFADPIHWLEFFPPIGKKDLQSFGLGVDWRRAFITTDVNPYYDKFIQWQFRTLLQRNRIKFGLRPSVFSRSRTHAQLTSLTTTHSFIHVPTLLPSHPSTHTDDKGALASAPSHFKTFTDLTTSPMLTTIVPLGREQCLKNTP